VKRLALLALAGLFATACQSDRLVSPSDTSVTSSDNALLASRFGRDAYRLPPPWAPGIRVMTYNLYLGTDLGPIMAATSQEEYLGLAFAAYAELQQTDFPARAGRIAEQIASAVPDAVGLQEVALWSVSAPYALTLPPGPPTAPFVTKYDFLQLVIDSLKARHLRYVAASVVPTSDVAAPVPTGFDATGNPTGFAVVRFQDHDAILVRAGVRYRDPQHGVYEAYIPLTLLGVDASLRRGWCSVEVTADHRTFRFVNSHLEAENGQINYLQAQELLGLLAHVREPVIWVGDFNSGPGAAADFTGAYSLVTQSGFTDLWPLAHRRDPGLTNGSADGVGSLDATGVLVPYPSLVFDKRVDLVMLRDRHFGRHDDVYAAILGNRPDDRTAAGLWPSDHAAVAMVLELPTRFARRR
jgi:endonuclease/exonuclease/phosphatase family metal-dependent hydrolase